MPLGERESEEGATEREKSEGGRKSEEKGKERITSF